MNMVLGKVHMCKRVDELKQYPVSITPNCMRYQNHVASAIRPEIYTTPFIGKNAFKVQYEQALQKKGGFKPPENRMQRPYDTYGSDAAMARVG